MDSLISQVQLLEFHVKPCYHEVIYIRTAVFSEENYVPQPSSFVGYIEIMVLNYGDHLSNNILWARMVIGRNGYGPKW